MAIYFLSWVGKVDFEEISGLVVRAENAQEARKVASQVAWDEGEEVWLDPSKSSCRRVSPSGKP